MAKEKVSLVREYTKGVWKENPTLITLLGLCPTLAVTNSAVNGIAMALATIFVLVGSSTIISLIRNVIPHQVRIAGYIVIIAAFVTLADRFMAAYYPPISKSLGPYVPLIVVNCIILGRAEAFAAKNNVGRSILDALGMGSGFFLVLFVLGSIRELLGAGSILGFQILGDWFTPWMVMILPPGAFLTLGILIAVTNHINARRSAA